MLGLVVLVLAAVLLAARVSPACAWRINPNTHCYISRSSSQIFYLSRYHPSLLFPTREPKVKKAKWRRSKVKARGKMNQVGPTFPRRLRRPSPCVRKLVNDRPSWCMQDGKGGSSANFGD